MTTPAQTFTEEFPALYDDLYRYLAYRIPNKADAEDVVAKTALLAWEKFDQYSPVRGTVAEWVMGIAKNQVRMYWRSHKVHCTLEELESLLSDERLSDGQDIHHRHLVEQIFAALNDEQKALLTLHYLDGIPYDALAVRAQTTTGSLRKKVSRTLLFLRERFSHLVE